MSKLCSCIWLLILPPLSPRLRGEMIAEFSCTRGEKIVEFFCTRGEEAVESFCLRGEKNSVDTSGRGAFDDSHR